MWVFSLPFVIVSECGYFTPYVMGLIGTAFFGLDQAGGVRRWNPERGVPSSVSGPALCLRRVISLNARLSLHRLWRS